MIKLPAVVLGMTSTLLGLYLISRGLGLGEQFGPQRTLGVVAGGDDLVADVAGLRRGQVRASGSNVQHKVSFSPLLKAYSVISLSLGRRCASIATELRPKPKSSSMAVSTLTVSEVAASSCSARTSPVTGSIA
mgnify:CR=1 FL=1